MATLYQPFSAPALDDPTPLEKRLRHVLLERRGFTLRHALIPLVLGTVALGVLLPLRPKPEPKRLSTDALEAKALALETELRQTQLELVKRAQAAPLQTLPQKRQRTFRVPYRTPSDGKSHRVVIRVEDDEGVHTAYERSHAFDTRVETEIKAVGQPKISLYDNEKLVAATTVRG